MKKKVLIAVALTMMLVLSFGVVNAAEVILYLEDFTLHPTGVEPIDWDTYAFIDPGAYAEVVVDDVHILQGNAMELYVVSNTDLGYAESKMDIIFGGETATVQFDLWLELIGGNVSIFNIIIVQDGVYIALIYDYSVNALYYVSDFSNLPVGVFDFSDYTTIKLEIDFTAGTYDLYVGDTTTPIVTNINLLPGTPPEDNYVLFVLSTPVVGNEASADIDNILISAADPPLVPNPRTGDMGGVLTKDIALRK